MSGDTVSSGFADDQSYLNVNIFDPDCRFSETLTEGKPKSGPAQE